MIDPSNFSKTNLTILRDERIGLVRITVTKENLKNVKKIINELKNYPVKISTNVIRMSRYTKNDLLNLVEQLSKLETQVIYLADSNGAMLPNELSEIFVESKNIIKNNNKQKLGFHGHNNLGLAEINALKSIKSGCDLIDGSILGYGKLSGNVPLEVFIPLLNKIGLNSHWNLEMIYVTAQYFYKFAAKSKYFSCRSKGALIGMKNLNLNEIKKDPNLLFNFKGVTKCEY
ncbi:4-hydroxy-2-oxovalerate aldolase [Staphylococcus sp. EZ-P03]|uniref:4-hydroxy-2-oxovalerate aldolase n=1 Tax=Staphylococcus sp. EZ-P03 TaxID=2282739 RepID=UPI000DF7A680|nr:4-hydroxy-2-oxovalerate aldolase [Staphylococcus sp. EZ-P03]